MKAIRTHTNKGFALLLALIVSSVVLAIGVSILRVSINQINLSATARESEFAFQAAHAGVDCMWYWRNQESVDYVSILSATPNPAVECFGVAPLSSTKDVLQDNAGIGIAYAYSNTFQWGDPERCTSVDMYVINAYSGDMTIPFGNEAIGTNGNKTCNVGNICTIIVSDGYNRSCSEVNSTIFSVQRELTVEF